MEEFLTECEECGAFIELGGHAPECPIGISEEEEFYWANIEPEPYFNEYTLSYSIY